MMFSIFKTVVHFSIAGRTGVWREEVIDNAELLHFVSIHLLKRQKPSEHQQALVFIVGPFRLMFIRINLTSSEDIS